MKYTKYDEINYLTEIDKYESIKNSKFYDVIKKSEIRHLTSDDAKEFSVFMKSLSEDEIMLLLFKILDDEYNSVIELHRKETQEEKIIREILSSKGIYEYFDVLYNQ